MIEQQLRDGLRVAVADEPPLGFDADRVADTAREAVRRRRAVLATGVGTATVVGAIAATVGLAGLSSQAPPAQSPSPPSPFAPSPPTPSPAAPNSATGTARASASLPPPSQPGQDPHGLRPRAEAMAAHLRAVLPTVVPGARDVRSDPFGQEALGDFSLSDSWVTGNVHFDDQLGRVNIVVEVRAGRDLPNPDLACEGSEHAEPPTYCGQLPQPDGSLVIVTESLLGPPTGGQPAKRVRSAEHFRDGAVVRVSTYTYDGFSRDPSPIVRDGFPLTDEQLVRLATDPALAL